MRRIHSAVEHVGALQLAVARVADGVDARDDEARVDEARRIFNQPEVVEASEVRLEWKPPDAAGLRAFLVDRHSFNEARVAKALERLSKVRASGTQTRLDSFFVTKEPRALPDSAKFDPFAKKKPAAGKAAGKRPTGAAAGGKGKQPKK